MLTQFANEEVAVEPGFLHRLQTYNVITTVNLLQQTYSIHQIVNQSSEFALEIKKMEEFCSIIQLTLTLMQKGKSDVQ